MIAHNGAVVDGEIRSGSEVTVAGHFDPWSFASHVPLKDVEGALGNRSRLSSIEVEVEVLEGILGVGLIAADFRTYVAPEVTVSSSAPPGECVRLPFGEGADSVMFRNGSAERAPLIFRVRSVSWTLDDPLSRERRYWGPADRIDYRALGVPDKPAMKLLSSLVEVVTSESLGTALGLDCTLSPAHGDLMRDPLTWKMDPDDARILAALYQAIDPVRHLEFGTWEGFGVVLCLEAAPRASVTTINLPDGEADAAGHPLYPSTGGGSPSDSGNRIGRLYREAGHADRVAQLFVDSTQWAPPPGTGTFDTVLIDGGHTADVVAVDTETAVKLVRPGGLVMWHDFCPVPRMMGSGLAARGVVEGVGEALAQWGEMFSRLVWVRPSMLLIGRRR